MTWRGANTDELTNLGNTLRRQREAITQVVGTVDRAIDGTRWEGPARDRFVEEWNGSFKQALSQLNDAFDAAGQDCVKRSDQLQQLL